jgi:hypothetical protein
MRGPYVFIEEQFFPTPELKNSTTFGEGLKNRTDLKNHPIGFIEKSENQKNRLTFSIKFNFQNLRKEN